MIFPETSTGQLDDLLARVCHNLELNLHRRKLAEERYNTIGNFLGDENSPLYHYRPQIYPQGSMRIGTSVRPIFQNEFDLDLVCEMLLDWERCDPVAVLNLIERRMRTSGTYEHIIERKNRCIRVNYADEFHLDILPAGPKTPNSNGYIMVPDRKAKTWKDSAPKPYADWFEEKAQTIRFEELFKAADVEPLRDPEAPERKPPLKRVVQLIKRYRDVTFRGDADSAPISIVLTTLAGNHYYGQKSISDALEQILVGIIRSTPADGTHLVVLNPKNNEEELSERWKNDHSAYLKFVKWVKNFYGAWVELKEMKGIDVIAGRLAEFFGEPVNKAVKQQAEFVKMAQELGYLRQNRSTGLLTGVSSALTIPVRRHTFYGK